MNVPNYLYHVTSADKYNSIIHSGLMRAIGNNAELCGAKEAKVYLCSEKDIPYWMILLGQYTVVKIDTTYVDPYDIDEFKYTYYGEYIAKSNIPLFAISLHKCNVGKAKAMEDICEDAVFTLSYIVFRLTQIVNYPCDYGHYFEELMRDINWIKQLFETKLDTKYLDVMRCRKKLIQQGEDGYYTMCDKYCIGGDTKTKLWEQLILYDFDDGKIQHVRDACYTINGIISKYISDVVSDLDTGGWMR